MFGNAARFRRIPFLLFFLLLVVLGACTEPPSSTKTPLLSSDPVVRWIHQHALPLRTTSPGGADTDLTPLKQMVGTARIVGLGEETHGTHEFIEMKARLVEFLISDMGFTTLVMENDWGSSQLLDTYINGGPGNLKTIMTKALFGSWQTQEYEGLFQWMRAYNATPAHATKIHFLGMDIQGLSQSDFTNVENYFQQTDPQHLSAIQQLYAPILSKSVLAPLGTYAALDASTKQQYQDQAQQVYNLLQANQRRDTAHSSAQGFALTLQNARIIVQFTTYTSTQAEKLQRDTFMAENVEWIDDHDAGAHPKLIVWAHDGHIANDTTYGSEDGENMGGELRVRYHQSYLPIGTTLYQGTFRTYTFYPSNQVRSISPPSSNTYTYTLGQAGLPLYLLDLRAIPSGAVSNWAQSSSVFPLYGLGGQDLSTPAQLSQWFDVIIHIQRTTPSAYFYASPGVG